MSRLPTSPTCWSALRLTAGSGSTTSPPAATRRTTRSCRRSAARPVARSSGRAMRHRSWRRSSRSRGCARSSATRRVSSPPSCRRSLRFIASATRRAPPRLASASDASIRYGSPMKLEIDEDAATVTVQNGAQVDTFPLASPEAFAAVSHAWLRCGWDTKYVYSCSWRGRPIIQLPEDMFRVQEVIYRIKPDVIIETGIAHGGSLVFYAALCRAMGRGRIIGVDVEIRPHNRAAIEAHELFPHLTLIDGSSIDPTVVQRVQEQVRPDETVFVMLDSNHAKQH